ncbi:MAG: hypothetical protein GC134_06950 [Proteobacteria bacterium]|nr:hypothetical protein [Pseudomonadota bacterium]
MTNKHVSDVPQLAPDRLEAMIAFASAQPQQRRRKAQRMAGLWRVLDTLFGQPAFGLGYACAVLVFGAVIGWEMPQTIEPQVQQAEEAAFIAIEGDETLEELTNLPWI